MRKISAKHVLNGKGQEGVSVNTFFLAASKSYPFANFSKLDLDGSKGINSSLFQVQKDSTFSAQISFILGVNFRYIVNLQNILR